MTERRERRINQTLSLLDAWTGIGAWARLVFVLGIVACFIWSIKTIAETVLWIRVLLG